MIRGIIISALILFGAYMFTSQHVGYKTAGKEYIKAVQEERQTIRVN